MAGSCERSTYGKTIQAQPGMSLRQLSIALNNWQPSPALADPGEVKGTRELVSPPYVVVYVPPKKLSKSCISGGFLAAQPVKLFPALLHGRIFPYTEGVEVHFTPEQQVQLAQIATNVGTNPERLVTDVVVRYLDDKTRFLEAVENGIAAAARGEIIEEEEMDARLERMFES